MWHTYGTGFITNIGKKEENKTYFLNKTEKGNFVVFRIVSRRYVNGENKFESMDCKRFITGDPESFCKLLQLKTMVSVDGVLEQYYNPETKITKYSINCTNVDLCGRPSESEESSKTSETKNHFE